MRTIFIIVALIMAIMAGVAMYPWDMSMQMGMSSAGAPAAGAFTFIDTGGVTFIDTGGVAFKDY